MTSEEIFTITAVEHVKAIGHYNVKALHKTTIEVTIDDYLTPRGDCIIGIKADKSPKEFNAEFKNALRNDDSKLFVILYSNGVWDYLIAHGSRLLSLSNHRKMIIRKSSYIDDATIGIKSNKAAIDLDRRLIKNLLEGYELFITLIVLKNQR